MGRPGPKTIREIARDLRLSRNTVRKVLRSAETAFSCGRQVQPLPKLGLWTDALDRLLAANAEAAARERLTLIRIFEELRALGYGGGYDAVRRYARRWSKAHSSATASAFVPLTFAPGETYQFDWSHEIVLMNGVTTTVKLAHVRLCMNRTMFVRASDYSSLIGSIPLDKGYDAILYNGAGSDAVAFGK